MPLFNRNNIVSILFLILFIGYSLYLFKSKARMVDNSLKSSIELMKYVEGELKENGIIPKIEGQRLLKSHDYIIDISDYGVISISYRNIQEGDVSVNLVPLVTPPRGALFEVFEHFLSLHEDIREQYGYKRSSNEYDGLRFQWVCLTRSSTFGRQYENRLIGYLGTIPSTWFPSICKAAGLNHFSADYFRSLP